MATQSGEGTRKHAKPAPSSGTRDGSVPCPESSLTWCLAQLCKEGSAAVAGQPGGLTGADNREREKSKDASRRLKASQWRALVAIRTQHIKGGSSRIGRYQAQGGLPPLLDLLRRPDRSRKILDLALSILANCCTEKETRTEVRKLDGVSVVVDVLKRNVSVETLENRAARALGNLAMDPEGSTRVHSADGVPPLLLCLSISPTPSSPSTLPVAQRHSSQKLECAQSAARALLYLSDTPAHRLSLLSQGALRSLVPFLAPEYPFALRRASLRALHELTRGCGAECAREVSLSGALGLLGPLATDEACRPLEELALKTLANLCSQGCLRPLVGSLGVIQRFTEEVKKDPLRSGVIFRALCLCCKEAVNRVKVKESGGLEVLIGFLAAHPNHPFTRLAILACVDFVYDESALEQLQELGLVPLLVTRLVELAKGEELSQGKVDGTLSPGSPCSELMTSCFDSFDFPPPEGSRKEDMGKEHGPGSSSFLSLRSWLVSEGLISSEGDLLESPAGSERDWQGLHPSSSPSSSSHSPDAQPVSSPPVRPKSSRVSITSSAGVGTTQPAPAKLGNSISLSPLHLSSTPTTPTKPSFPTSPLRLSSPPRKRPRVSSISSSSSCSSSSSHSRVVALDPLPVLSRAPTYSHPYHPEPWTPESPVLLLLSRFSHATDPSAALVNTGALSGLLFYLTRHTDPSARCFRMLTRLSCNPNCLQPLVRTGAPALIRYRLCLHGEEEEEKEEEERQSDRVKAKLRQLGMGLLGNVRVQSESAFGAGVLTHVLLSGSEADRLLCVLSLPLINSNRVLLKKLLLDSGGLLAALEPLCCQCDSEDVADQTSKCKTFLLNWLHPLEQASASKLHSLYSSLLIGCLSTLLAYSKEDHEKKGSGLDSSSFVEALKSSSKTVSASGEGADLSSLTSCPYNQSTHDLSFLLNDGTLLSANQEAVAGEKEGDGTGSEYFRALLRGGFEESRGGVASDIINIRDVSRGTLLPVLHFLHGCRLSVGPGGPQGMMEEGGGQGDGRCAVLASLAAGGLVAPQGGGMRRGFLHTPLGEVLVGASMFLVPGLQREVEELCVSLLRSAACRVSSQPQRRRRTKSSQSDQPGENMSTANQEQDESNGTSRLPAPGGSSCSLNPSTTAPLTPDPARPRPTTTQSRETSGPDPNTLSLPPVCPSTLGSGGSEGSVLLVLLPQVYWFSQRYCYPRLGKACLDLLLQQSLPPSLAAACLLHVARQADCTERLKHDLLTLATAALS